jgi:hypothetical protein
MTDRVRMWSAAGSIALLVLGLLGVLFDFTPLSTTCLLLFFVLAPGAAAIQCLPDIEAGIGLGIAALCGPVVILSLGLMMVEIPYWHPLVAALLVGIPSCLGNLYGLVAAQRTARSRS